MFDDDSSHGPEWSQGKMRWRKSSFSATSECVVFSELDEATIVRNSNQPTGGSVPVSRAALAAWIAGCKAGELDDLA